MNHKSTFSSLSLTLTDRRVSESIEGPARPSDELHCQNTSSTAFQSVIAIVFRTSHTAEH